MTSTSDIQNGTWRELLGPEWVGAATVLAGGVALYAINMYVTASLLPTAVADIGGEHLYAWSTTAFFITSVISSTLVGRVLATRGAVRAYLLGLGVFALGTLGCAVSPSMELLLAGRAVQGLGGGLLAGLGYAVIHAALPQHLWTRAAALVSAMWGVGTFAGPGIGGLLAQLGVWRLAFGVLAGLAVLIAVVVPRALPHGTRPGAVDPVPVRSLVLLATTAGLVSVAGILPHGWQTVVAVLGAVALLGTFLGTESVAAVRVLPASVFSRRSPLRWIYLTLAVLSVGSTVETFVPLFGQRLAGLAPLAAGFVGAALSLGWSVGQVLSSNASSGRTIRRLTLAAPAVLALGLTATALLQRTEVGGFTLALWVVALMVAGSGIGLAYPHLTVMVMTSTPDEAEAAKASAAINTVELIAFAFGSAIAGVLVNLGTSTVGAARLLLGGFAVLALAGVLSARAAVVRR